uniref:Transcription factor STE12 n=1 Tax=Volvariella volvacea TaxID=36659 RepID=R9WYT0_9AGAR|nr:transcription factor STE12 [Volvariella volvacea]
MSSHPLILYVSLLITLLLTLSTPHPQVLLPGLPTPHHCFHTLPPYIPLITDIQQQQMYQQPQQQHQTYYPGSASSSNRSSPQSYAEPDTYSQHPHLSSTPSLSQNHFIHPNLYRRAQPKNSTYSALQVTTSTSQSSNSDQDSEPTARPSNAHVHAQFHSQSVPLPRQTEDTTAFSSHAADPSLSDTQADSSDKDYTLSTPGLSRGLSRPLTPEEQKRLEELDRLKFFLATAPSRWTSSGSDASSGNSANSQMDTMSLVSNQAPSHPALNRFQLPSGEYVTCVLWNGLYHITGTDIVRALVFRFEAFGRPVRNMKKFEEGVFSDLRNLKPGIDACLEEPKVSDSEFHSRLIYPIRLVFFAQLWLSVLLDLQGVANERVIGEINDDDGQVRKEALLNRQEKNGARNIRLEMREAPALPTRERAT